MPGGAQAGWQAHHLHWQARASEVSPDGSSLLLLTPRGAEASNIPLGSRSGCRALSCVLGASGGAVLLAVPELLGNSCGASP